MKKIRVVIAGYGNVGRGVRQALARACDMELAGIVSRSPERVKKEIGDAVPVLPIADTAAWVAAFRPDAAILCYPVVTLFESHRHKHSATNLLGERVDELAPKLSLDKIADEKTPRTFIWHTASDELVPVLNSLRYAERLREVGVPFELHIFPDGRHGLGLAESNPHVAEWAELLRKWLIYYGWME